MQAGDLDRLSRFIWSLPANELLHGSESVLRARVSVAFHRANYRELYNLLETNSFSQQYHTELQNVWYRAHYKVNKKKKKFLFFLVRPAGQQVSPGPLGMCGPRAPKQKRKLSFLKNQIKIKLNEIEFFFFLRELYTD